MTRRRTVAIVILFLFAALTGPALVLFDTDRGEAAFGDNESIGLNELGAASVAIEVGPNTVTFNVVKMAPGDRFVGQIDVKNDGTLPLLYSLAAEPQVGEQRLLDVLEWRIWPSNSAGSCGAPARLLFVGVLSGERVVGSSAIGADAGDRLIAVGSRDVLCFDVVLPIDVSNRFQNAAANIELILVAEQATEVAP